MENKKKRVNTDPTMSMIRDIFQENLQLVNRVQRKSKSDIVTKYDLTEKLCARRMKAVAHLMPEMQERYAKTYPEIDIKSEFADIASLPVLSYDIIDEESYLCLGAAIWMLDQIWEEHEMQELCDLLPEECDYVDIPDVYDARFSDEIIEGMLWAVQNRYGETDRYVVPPNILSKKDDSVFHKILDMIPDRAKEAAAAQLKSKFWEWADLYFKALSPLVHEMRRQEENLDRLTDQIEEIKKKLDAKDSPDKNEALKRLEAKLEPVIRFFNGNAPENVNAIFGSKEAIEKYKQSIGDEAVASLRLYTEANEKDMRKHGVLTIKEQLNKILERLTSHIENDKLTSEKSRQKQSSISELWQIIRPDKAISTIRLLWSKVPDGWHKNPYAWAGIGCMLVFFALFAVSWVQWHEYREENRRLRTVADKHHVTTIMLNELHPGLAVTVGAYEKLVDVVGADSTLVIFNRQVKTVREEEKQSKQQK